MNEGWRRPAHVKWPDRPHNACTKGICAATVTRNNLDSESNTRKPQDQYLVPFLASKTLHSRKRQSPNSSCCLLILFGWVMKEITAGGNPIKSPNLKNLKIVLLLKKECGGFFPSPALLIRSEFISYGIIFFWWCDISCCKKSLTMGLLSCYLRRFEAWLTIV